jgi:predicted enzyme related to lactoylglutathione lyase
MTERERYVPGVPCWVDMTSPDPEAAAEFYKGLFGWELEDAMPAGSAGKYFIARIRGGDVAAVGSQSEGAPPMAVWNTYVWVDSADRTAVKVEAAGGQVLRAPFDVAEAGRMAVFSDPEGAVFCVWQAGKHRGAQIINEHGSVNFNNLNTHDVEGAKAFYGAVFGWHTLDLPGFHAWSLRSYGDRLEELDPGLRERIGSVGAPGGFEDVVAALIPLGDDQPGVPANWSVTFAVHDSDAIAEQATQLGGQVVLPPFDAPWVRMTVITDPQGATFTASKFVPENRDLAVAAPSASAAQS